ncbi:hypothetical protein GCM10028775_59010 [Catellatospora paridis]
MAAYQSAASRGHDTVGTRHLLLELLQDDGCAAHGALTVQGVTYQAVDQRVEYATMELCPSRPRFERGTEQALVYALREARRLGHDLAGTGHILQGVLRDKSGSGPHLLRLLGVNPIQAQSQPLFAEDPAPVPYPLPIFKTSIGQRDLAFVDRLLARCSDALGEENAG